ncbi:spore germination protein GerW family protein [Psychrobacillus sp. FJAT-51614]|uniref:Spore germination protein GerW family protein n=1 Tax=Psychrobacillus mangrovi TaxID=3117745 RepID=A0ABU8F6R4_9BACI
MEDGKNSNEKPKAYRSPIGVIFDKFSQSKDVSLIYGEPIELENKRVLPVAKVDYYVGGGGGYSNAEENNSTAQGEGGGGYISVKPVGVFEITSSKVKFKPVIRWDFFLTLFSIITFGLILLRKKSAR